MGGQPALYLGSKIINIGPRVTDLSKVSRNRYVRCILPRYGVCVCVCVCMLINDYCSLDLGIPGNQFVVYNNTNLQVCVVMLVLPVSGGCFIW